MKKLHSLVCAFWFCTLSCHCVYAASAKDDALDYQACILQLRHISSDKLKSIMADGSRLEDRATKLSVLAVNSCAKERKRLVSDMNNEGKSEPKYYDLIDQIEDASKITIQARLMDLAAKKVPTQ